jgi:Zn-dependent protease with chaperone function
VGEDTGTSRRALFKVELAFGVLGLTVALLALVIAMDTVQHHALELGAMLYHFDARRFESQSALAIGLGLVDAVVLARAVGSLVRQLRAHRRFRREFGVREVALVHGYVVRVFAGEALEAFCAGLARPAVYVSDATLRRVGETELRAILAHEAHHRARRDPLRLLLARTCSDAFRPLPPFARLADRLAAVADLAADAAAVRTMGDVTPLASALVRFEESSGIAPERVDHLVRDTPPETVSGWLLAAAGLALAGLAALPAPMLLLGWHPDLTVPLALELAALLAACTPACLAARRADACLRPVA